MGDWVETTRLSLGAFLTSPGAGILGLIGAGWLTLRGVDKRLAGDQRMAHEAREAEYRKDLEADARERWQLAYDWLWENRAELPADSLITGIKELRRLVETRQQSAMLEVFASSLEQEAEEAL